tara:strand:- start:17 stop:247 length:231 start_codon:yes stop_codon:yes gene_type:complete
MTIATYFTYLMSFIVIGEGLNCMYPRIEEHYDSEGFVCSWEEDDFYLINDQYILAPEDSTDNCFEAKSRKRYWERQ